MKCEGCGKEIPEETLCYQVRTGYIEDDGFYAYGDIEYFHVRCYATEEDIHGLQSTGNGPRRR